MQLCALISDIPSFASLTFPRGGQKKPTNFQLNKHEQTRRCDRKTPPVQKNAAERTSTIQGKEKINKCKGSYGIPVLVTFLVCGAEVFGITDFGSIFASCTI